MNVQQFLLSSMLFLSICGLPLSGLDQYPSTEEAAFYHHHSQQQWNVAYEALKKLEFQGNEQVLDIGCGTGKITANIAGRVPNGSVLGLDISQGMTVFAQKIYPPFYNNLSFLKADILNFVSSPSPSKFDVICSFNSLHWIL